MYSLADLGEWGKDRENMRKLLAEQCEKCGGFFTEVKDDPRYKNRELWRIAYDDELGRFCLVAREHSVFFDTVERLCKHISETTHYELRLHYFTGYNGRICVIATLKDVSWKQHQAENSGNKEPEAPEETAEA